VHRQGQFRVAKMREGAVVQVHESGEPAWIAANDGQHEREAVLRRAHRSLRATIVGGIVGNWHTRPSLEPWRPPFRCCGTLGTSGTDQAFGRPRERTVT